MPSTKKASQISLKGFYVGEPGFEPGTPWSQTKCATGLRYTPKIFLEIILSNLKCGEGGIRTLGTV